jgi:hypothetical protein
VTAVIAENRKIDRNSDLWDCGGMKTVFDLPEPLMRDVKARASNEGRRMVDLVADLLRHGLDIPTVTSATPGQTPRLERHPRTGLPVIRTRKSPGFVPPTLDESLKIIQQANEEDDLRHAGILD